MASAGYRRWEGRPLRFIVTPGVTGDVTRAPGVLDGLEHFRRVATLNDRRAIHFSGFVHLAAVMIWRRWMSIRAGDVP